MSVTIPDVMRLVGQYGDAVLEGPALPHIEAIHAALLALVAQARDEEAEACAALCEHLWTRAGDADECTDAIRARIAARKGE